MKEDLGWPSRRKYNSTTTKLKLVDLEYDEKQDLSIVLNEDRMEAESNKGCRLKMILVLKTQMPSNDGTLDSI